ncbi:uroporphyrinogen decarboxylase [Calycomorphotria hydatis]|uniref:Uroporphyrinogen decarboxylase n=1 Tax=Calycomorphotria hydatis TaxID=2528027 RepID=A0A517T9J7_9PLAN|nr:uroporphyrinogen decarboxylase [Calycomorphotria hydatis]QDT65047.1 Uroporphyrinogen decarboxylase [Calycomorphotria hydatis]
MTLTPALENSRFMRAVHRQPVDTTPLWIMRQAGRYLPEYQRIRSGNTFLEFCKRPDLAAEATVSAQAVLGVDAAILFADLPTILEPIGFELDYQPGPVIANPFRKPEDLKRIREFEDIGEMGYVLETVKLVRSELPADIPLIGFAGCPFTLASYAVEGAGSRNYVHVKSLMYNHPEVWNEFAALMTRAVAKYLIAQFDAGCQVVQLFDSWAGCLSPGDYRRFVLPHMKNLIAAISPHGPVINFLTGNPALLSACAEAGGDVIGLDWRVDLAEGWKTVGYDRGVQGNLDPIVLFAEMDTIKREATAILKAAAGRPGHIFNLGHGVLPDMNPDHVKGLVQIVHEEGARIIESCGS